MSWSMAGNTIALTKLLPPNSLSQQSPGAITTTTIVTRRRQLPSSSAKAASSTPPQRLVIAQACKNWSSMPRHRQPSTTYALTHSPHKGRPSMPRHRRPPRRRLGLILTGSVFYSTVTFADSRRHHPSLLLLLLLFLLLLRFLLRDDVGGRLTVGCCPPPLRSRLNSRIATRCSVLRSFASWARDDERSPSRPTPT